jgi:hypothetical protein
MRSISGAIVLLSGTVLIGAEIILGVFTNVMEASYFPTCARAERLTTLLQARGIATQVLQDGHIDWDGSSFPMGQRVGIEVADADFERAKTIVDAAG